MTNGPNIRTSRSVIPSVSSSFIFSTPHLFKRFANSTLTCRICVVFLYPPSQDSLIQVTEESYKSCNLKDPILYMNNGNSLFNITSEGEFYFTSAESGHCQKHQKLHITVGVGGNTDTLSPSSLPQSAPSYPTAFGDIPMSASSTSSSPHPNSRFSFILIGFFLCALFPTLLR